MAKIQQAQNSIFSFAYNVENQKKLYDDITQLINQIDAVFYNEQVEHKLVIDETLAPAEPFQLAFQQKFCDSLFLNKAIWSMAFENNFMFQKEIQQLKRVAVEINKLKKTWVRGDVRNKIIATAKELKSNKIFNLSLVYLPPITTFNLRQSIFCRKPNKFSMEQDSQF